VRFVSKDSRTQRASRREARHLANPRSEIAGYLSGKKPDPQLRFPPSAIIRAIRGEIRIHSIFIPFVAFCKICLF
jgi:hypothetical protein